MKSAGSLSIEPFGPSRWRLRRTRPSQLWLFNRTVHGCGGVPGRADAAILSVTTPKTCGMPRARASTWSAGQTSGARAYERDTTAWRIEGLGLRRVMEDVGQQRFEKEAPRGQTLDDAHGGATARTRPRRPRG